MKDSEQQLKDDIKELKNKLEKDGHQVKKSRSFHFDIKKVLMYALPFIIIIIFLVGFLAGAKFNPEENDQTISDQNIDDNPVIDQDPEVEEEEEEIPLPPEEEDEVEVIFGDNDCFDSDGGSFPLKYGYVIDKSREEYKDECINKNLLYEMYCNPVGYKDKKIIDCDFGCNGGACLDGNVVEEDLDCLDSDGGTFPNEIGYVIDRNDERYDDECENAAAVKEYFCNPLGYKDNSIISCDYKCEFGKCIEGIVNDAQDCIDSDASNIYKQGYVIDINEKQSDDYCYDQMNVYEMRCTNFGYANPRLFYCEHGCVDGACLME